MPTWRPQSFRQASIREGVDKEVVNHAIRTAKLLSSRTRNAPPIFTLKHLSHLTGVQYGFLRRCVEREHPEPYRLFRIRKRQLSDEKKQRYRIICVPDARLMAVQRWINLNILNLAGAHPASVAFSTGNNIRKAAHSHCGCHWLIKIDIVNFFESVSEQSVYHVFNKLGYQPLVAFELARLCTRLGKPSHARRGKRWKNSRFLDREIAAYENSRLGHLPQGAPTSPRLANLAVLKLDQEIERIADESDLIYTRYADDLTISSTNRTFSRDQARSILGQIYMLLRRYGFEPNLAKTKLVPPGGRKVVLGLLVDGDEPKLTKKYRDLLRQHLHFMLREDVGPVRHAEARGFQSVYGLRNHVRGLIAYAEQIDESYADSLWREFNAIEWP